MTPPKTLVRAIHAHNSAMRVRYAKASQRWSIEVRMPARHPEFLRIVKPPVLRDTTVAKIAFDRYEAMQDGYFPVFTVPLDRGTDVDGVLAGIRENDAAAQGSLAKINQALDDAQALWEAQQDKARKTYAQERASDAADALQWAGGHVIATPMTEQPSVVTDHVEQREGYELRVRKGLHRSVA